MRQFRVLSIAIVISVSVFQAPVPIFGYQSQSTASGPAGSASGQQAVPDADKQGQSPPIVLSTNEVVVNVVARDKKKRLVTDLDSSNFQVYEDGKLQRIASFRIHEPEPQPPASVPDDQVDKSKILAFPGQNPFSGANVVALVFDRLSAQGRRLAQQAALKCLSDRFRPDDFAGIFSLDLTLNFWQTPFRILQPFTNNRDYISRAIRQMYDTGTPDRDDTLANTLDADEKPGDANANTVSQTLAQLPGQGLRAFPGPDVSRQFGLVYRDQIIGVEMDTLLSIINLMSRLDGRKSIVFFSEGLATSPSDPVNGYRLQAITAIAKAADVTIYTVDAGGLRLSSPTSPYPDAGLTMIAEDTGGFLVSGTNDLRPGLSRIGEEINTYYVLSYVPENEQYTGRYRHIKVKVDRPDVHLETRKGYYAVAKNYLNPIAGWESPAMAVVKNGQYDNQLAMQARVFSFPDPKEPGLVPVFVQVPASEITYQFDKDKNVYNSDLSILTVFKDISNQIVARAGKHYQMTVPSDQIDEARRGDVLFYRQADLPAGLYFVEAVAYDAATGKYSTRATSIEVPFARNGDGLNMSSVVLLKNAQPVSAAAANIDTPFHYGGVQMYPNLGEPLSRARDKNLVFYFDVYTPKASPKHPLKLSLTIDIFKDGKLLTSGSPVLGPPDANGLIQYVSALPLAPFQPGDYSMRIKVSDNKVSTWRLANFTVRP